QVRAARIDKVNARQIVVAGDFLCAQVLFHRHRIVRAALDRRVVADDHAFAAGDASDAGDDSGGGDVVVVHAERRQLREFEEGRARVEQGTDALAWQELATGDVLRACRLAAALLDRGDLHAKVSDQRRHRLAVFHRGWITKIERGFDDGHTRDQLFDGSG